MKYFSSIITICTLALSLSSCEQEAVAPEQQITGRYALDDGSGTTDTYLEFSKGRLSFYISNSLYPLAENKIWDCDEDKFEQVSSSNYSITDEVLVSSRGNIGKVELSNGKLHVGADIYSELKGFTNEYYSVIRPSKDRLDLTYASETVELAINVENALPAWSLQAQTNTEWISGLKVENNILKFKTSSTATDRTGVIKLKYPHAESVALSVSQKPSTFIKPASETMTFGYEASSQTLGYTIENPISGSSLSATSDASWISDIQVSETQISFKLGENNARYDRKASLRLMYDGAPIVTVPVTQKWSASSFTLTPANQETAYTGGSFSFDFAVNNPRADVNVVAASQANWITDVAVFGNKVTYKVAENNSGAQRTGKIKLTYGSYATAEFTVMQIGKPVTSLSLNKSSLALHPGNSEKLVATVEPSDATLTWSSSDTSVATASSDGTVTATGNGTATITVSATDGSGKNAKCTVTVTTLVSSITLDKTSLTLHPGESSILTPTVLPTTASNKALTWTSSEPSVATVNAEGKVTAVSKGTATIKTKAKDGSGKYATCEVIVRKLGPLPTGAVDLGLSVYWATTNLGASKPEEYGDYYAWGETEPKENYSWTTYKWCNGSFDTLTKYNGSSSHGTVDNKIVLDPKDDAAHVRLGGKWRMPTDAELTELREKCKWTWTTQNGVKGRLVTGPNGNSIFLPAAGRRDDTDLLYVGSSGCYWSSSLMYYPYYAWFVYFESGRIWRDGHCYRSSGQSVRPVSE